jgi:hypothetical protein
MFQAMINGSLAVLTKPSVGTFEQHEKNNLAWALIYAAIAGVICALIRAVTLPLRLSQIRQQLEAIGMAGAELEAVLATQSGGGLVGSVISTLLSTIIGSLILWGIVYGLGRAFGGTGAFGELAWNVSLFTSPLAVIFMIVSVIGGLIPLLGGILAFGLFLYGLYLDYLAIQSGMNLPSNKALYVILILFLIGLILFCLVFGAALLAIIGLGAARGLAP